MLTRTADEIFEPGSNTEQRFGAGWLFALPNPTPDRVLVVGKITEPSHRALRAASQEVRFTKPDQVVSGLGPWDLIVLAGRAAQASDVVQRCAASLSTTGAIYAEIPRNVGQPINPKRFVDELDVAELDAQLFRLTPVVGEVGALIPEAHQSVAGDLAERGLLGRVVKQRRLAPAEQVMKRLGSVPRFHRWAAVLTRPNAEQGIPPLYVSSLAEGAGQMLGRLPWAVSATGSYPSRKVLVMLYNGTGNLDRVIKLTRTEEFNDRLVNEGAVLQDLGGKGLLDDGLAPKVWCSGLAGRLAAVGEEAVSGPILQDELRRTGSLDLARAGAELFTSIGVATRNMVTPERAAEGLSDLLRRVHNFYQLSASELEFMEKQIAVIGDSTNPFPSVLQHGDAGTWNAVTPSPSQVMMLDWEAAEFDGYPLWDLVYFLRSAAVAILRNRGQQDQTEAYAHAFLQQNDISALISAEISKYTEAIDLDPALVEPLFFTQWTFRMLREIRRLTPKTAAEGKFVKLLRTGIAAAESGRPMPLWKR